MATNFHEHYEQRATELPSERSTGLVFAGVALVVAVLWRQAPVALWAALAAAAGFVAVSLTAPSLLKPLNILWFRFGLLLHRVVSPAVMFGMFTLVFTPAGLLMRFCYDPLRKRRAASSSTYWIEYQSSGPREGSMINQF